MAASLQNIHTGSYPVLRRHKKLSDSYFFRLCYGYVLVVVFCLLATLRKNFRRDLHESFREGWQWAIEQLVKFWWRSGLPSGYRDCFPDSSLLGDTESGINRLRCATLQSRTRTNRHRHDGNYDVITSPALGGGMHCPSASCLLIFYSF